MPCKCLTGCINKKCSCRAKGIHCTDECTYCSMKEKYECYNVPGKEPPVKSKPKSKKGSRRSSKASSDSDYSDTETALVKSSKDLTKKKEENNDKVIHQTVIINNYYSHNEYKQQNNSYTQVVNHNYENNNSGSNDQNVNHLIKNLSISDDENDSSESSRSVDNSNNTTKKTSTLPSVPKLTESLANEFLKFYWECLSTKDKTKYLEKYVSTGAELRIQGIPFIGARTITERLEEAAPMKINKMDFKINPISNPTPKKFSVSEINKKLLPAASMASASSSASSTPPELESSSSDKSKSNTNTVNKLLAKYHQNNSKSSINESGESKSLVFTNPNLPSIGKIETNGEMMDCNGYTAEFNQIFYLVYNRISNVVQIKNSELNWKS
ncbi:hypothetical protein PIROE2DRAFT_9623 [Piromyces sp. E2]|nr:hypothetical protein PIROE2DRAFT_9623 [Piromyces sp. E2]|eukprot:OUM63761.1 hypothetical protein PIROE2DRAFT_9623 [Piromyces sp. E2]